jgi:hypothetical protein
MHSDACSHTAGRKDTMPDLKDDIIAYDAMRADLELKHPGKWVVIYDRRLVDVFESFDAAAIRAVREFGRGPYLIRQIGAAPLTLPSAALYHPVHG